jgi:hypothetical protein
MMRSEGSANGEQYERIQFESFEDLEAYFMAECWGKPGLRTKVIGTVLLVQKRKEN